MNNNFKKSKSMCGIFGGTVSPIEVRKALKKMNRGQDGEKVTYFKKTKITLGFKRHAVIAPEDKKSMQPFVDKEKKSAIVMNGEIFEYKKIKSKLENKGIIFDSEGDAEVLLKWYHEKGDKFCDNLDSMYAGGIYEENDKNSKIIIFRDWVGEEPLHYIYNKEEQRFIFSSEIKGFTGLSFYKLEDVCSLEPGTILSVNLNDFSKKEIKYYTLNKTQNFRYKNLQQIGKEIRKRLEQATKERIISDVPLCCLLSGGLDSSVTAYLLNEIMKKQGKKLTLYTFHVKEEPIVKGTDLYHARIVADTLGLRENLVEVIVPRKEIIKTLPKVVYSLEDKRFKDYNIYPAIYNYFLAKRMAKDGFKVAFNGEGSDELHGSYPHWGTFMINQEKITKPEFRIQMVGNLHKGILMRTSKVMMYAGPIEMRTLFLSKKVVEYIVNVPEEFLRKGRVWKQPLVCAFKNALPSKILKRPKAYPQDATGLTAMRGLLLNKYSRYGPSEYEILNKIFDRYYCKKNAKIQIEN